MAVIMAFINLTWCIKLIFHGLTHVGCSFPVFELCYRQTKTMQNVAMTR